MIMPPSQPYGPAPSEPKPEQYDFIVNYGKHSHSNKLIALDNTSLKTRLLVTGIGGFVLIVIIWILVALLSSSTTSVSSPLTSIVKQQADIAQVSLAAGQTATEQPTQNFAITTDLSLLSEQNAFVTYLRSLGSKPSSNDLQATPNSKTEASLRAAQNAGVYDQTYIAIAQSQLTTYEHSLQQAFANTNNLKERQLLSSAYNQAQLLMQQSTQTE